MRPIDVAAAVFVAVVWGIAFVATEYALQSFSAPQLAILRFVIAALPVFFVRRPNLPWRYLIALGLFLFTGQFLFLFFSYEAGMPPGLASVLTHTQALMTIVLGVIILRERPSATQLLAIVVAVVGLVLVGRSIDGSLTLLGLALILLGALSWSFGNIILRTLDKTDMFALMIWISIVPPLPAFILSWIMGDTPGLVEATISASTVSIVSVIFLATISTTLAYALWGSLLTRYPTHRVTPFALFAPCAGILSSYIAFGETVDTLRGFGMLLVFLGVAACLLFSGKSATRANDPAPEDGQRKHQ